MPTALTDYRTPNLVRSLSATSVIAARTGSNSRPRGVRLYSTCAGVVGSVVRSITPWVSMVRSRSVSTLVETLPRSRRKSPKRRGPWPRNQIIRAVHALDRNFRQASSGQSRGGPGRRGLRGVMVVPIGLRAGAIVARQRYEHDAVCDGNVVPQIVTFR